MEGANNEGNSPLDMSMSSTSSIDKKTLRRIKNQSVIRQIFLAWKTFTRQVAMDKRLFFKIRDFIIKRLSSKAFKSLKVHYIIETLVKHINRKRSKRVLRDTYHSWLYVKKLNQKQSLSLLTLSSLLEKRLAFSTILNYSLKMK